MFYKIFSDIDPLEYVLVAAGSDEEDLGPKPEIFNLGCPTFQCDKIDEVPGGGLSRVASAGGMIGDTPILCGGYHPEDERRYGTCRKLIKKNNGKYAWLVLDNTLSIGRYFPSYGSVVIEDQLLVSGGVIDFGGPFSVLQELVSLDGVSTSSVMEFPTYYGQCMVGWALFFGFAILKPNAIP